MAGQPVGLEGTSFRYHHDAGLPGSAEVVQRIADQQVSLVVIEHELGAYNPVVVRELVQAYRVLGSCALGTDYGWAHYHLFVPATRPDRFTPPAGTRCSGAGPMPPEYLQIAASASPAGRADPARSAH